MKKNIVLSFIFILLLFSCKNKKDKNMLEGKIERESISVVSKVPGRLAELKINEGDMVKKGDTLAILEIPEIDAKKKQALGAIKSAEAQYQMAEKGATDNQLKELKAKKSALKEQYEFAKKSLDRISQMVSDSLVPQQKYDEVYAKYQGALSQLNAVNAEIADVEHGVRVEQQVMALGQKDRAEGALQEVDAAENEKYIIAPQDMKVETITLKIGELTLPGYTIIKGDLINSTYFRFTIPESKLSKIKINQNLNIYINYSKQKIVGLVQNIKQLPSYANISSAYPEYDVDDSLYEIKIIPSDIKSAEELFNHSLVTLNL